MKIMFDSLEGLLTELRDRKIEVVRLCSAIHCDAGVRTAGIPHLTRRIVVTAAIDTDLWAEWRYFVGRGVAEVGERGLHPSEALTKRGDEMLATISQRIDDAGFEI
ncbi:MAG TPA: hypothetical protein VMR23_05995, partial [Candidatus Limnocylindria bacterium]|nr:hypothetical protein [Candidatus Limnocylindria bacterium]